MTDYTDLKARLGRFATLYGYCTDDTIAANTAQAATEALAAIDALEAEVARLRGGDMDRVETGKVQIGDDWPGVFIRGDHALHYAITLQNYLETPERSLIGSAMLDGLVKTLAGAEARNGIDPVMLTRSDLAATDLAELVEALETAHECLLWCAREGRMASPNLSRYPEKWAENLEKLLTKIKEPQTRLEGA